MHWTHQIKLDTRRIKRIQTYTKTDKKGSPWTIGNGITQKIN